MDRIQNILVGLDLADGDWVVARDLGDQSRAALRRAKYLAKQHGARICFFHSVDLAPHTETMMQEHKLESSIIGAARELLVNLVEECEKDGLEAKGIVTFGRAWMELIRQARRSNSDLVVVSTRQPTPFRATLFGSTAMKLLRKCPCPVWVTLQKSTESFRRILVPVDLTPASTRALHLASSLAAKEEATLHVLHVLELPQLYLQRISDAETRIRDFKESVRQQAEDRLAECLQDPKLVDPGLNVKSSLKEGDPAETILEFIDSVEPDLVVMGTLGRAGMAGFFIGNTAERVLPRLPCSLLAVKPPGFISPIETEHTLQSSRALPV